MDIISGGVKKGRGGHATQTYMALVLKGLILLLYENLTYILVVHSILSSLL